ncbi:MAG: DUF5036 family protein [Lepagella sp.]
MKRTVKLLMIALLTACMMGCSKDDPEETGKIDADKNVADPEGTVTLSMRNGDDTTLDGFGIGSDNNFHCTENGTQYFFVDLGAVKGLGNVTIIPTSGWAKSVKVIPGHGYVAAKIESVYGFGYDYSNPKFYRIYVEDYIGEAVTNGVIGFDIKYQVPFAGAEVPISVGNENVVLSQENPTVEVKTSNKSFTNFSIVNKSLAEVNTIQDDVAQFIKTGVKISMPSDPNLWPKVDTEGTIELKTGNGDMTTINVTIKGVGDFISIPENKITLQPNETNYNNYYNDPRVIEFMTNIDRSQINVKTSADWLKAEVQSNTIVIKNSCNTSLSKRKGTITLSYKNVSETIEVEQEGFAFIPTFSDIDVDANGIQQYQYIYIDSSKGSTLYCYYFRYVVREGSDWCWIKDQYNGEDYYYLHVNSNNTQESREAVVDVYYRNLFSGFDETLYTTFKVKQKGKE